MVRIFKQAALYGDSGRRVGDADGLRAVVLGLDAWVADLVRDFRSQAADVDLLVRPEAPLR
jgi:hypothetical protein